MKPDVKRWFILLCGILANLCQGAAYSSSIFAGPMLQHLNLMVQKPDGTMAPDMPKWVLAFSINLAMLPIGMLLSGKIADQKSPRIVVLFGGLIFGLGMLLAGFSTSLTMLYLTFGVMMGLGSGAAYGAIVATSVRWFPDRKGLASGLAVAALGFGPFVIVPVAGALMQHDPDPSVAILYTLKTLGIMFIAIMGLASIIMTNPEKGYLPEGYTPPAPTVKNAASRGTDMMWTDMIKKSRFWMLYILYAFGAFSGLMIISQAKQIAMGLESTFADPAAAAKFAAFVVQMLALANASGRVVWGFISDRIGRIQALGLMFFITAATMLLMPMLSTAQTTMLIAAVLIGACYGGYLGIFPSLCADSFGSKFLGVNYALLFSAFSVAAIIGPMVGATIFKQSGSFNMAFTTAGILALLGAILAVGMVMNSKKQESLESA
ncbi:MAG: L-lactate MFS transporter [Armatimonadota bacterium]